MKFAFLTNQPSYYQIHFAQAMASRLGEDNFRIVFAKGLSADRHEMGWQDEYHQPYIIRLSDSPSQKKECEHWIESADVVIQGRFPVKHVRKRIESGKLTFACQERLWKKPVSRYRKLSRLPHLYKNYFSLNKPNYHFLAVGAYAAQDMLDLGVFRDRCWQYGYFIDCPSYQPKAVKDHLELLWCGRFCEFKQPLKAIELLAAFKKFGLNIRLTMIGDGELKPQAELLAATLGVLELVRFPGWQTQPQITEYMKNADLFAMTSHQGEGWGLVINEAMSLGCAVIANQDLGSSTVLVEHGKSGFLYQGNDVTNIAKEVSGHSIEQLLDIGKNAHTSMMQNWSAEQAATATIALSEQLLSGQMGQARRNGSSGICSPI